MIEDMKGNEITLSQFKQIARVALTGVECGAPIVEVMEVLGKEECSKRLRKAMEEISVVDGG